jgi:heat-inducible transcriptional repressor
MIDLSARQVQILRAVVQEFINTAESVGSETIDKKFNLGVSPATIRNDMVQLTKLGYLKKSHSSSGRQPTPLAMKLFIRELMKEKDLSVADEVSLKERVWSERGHLENLLRASTRLLAEKTDAVGIAITGDSIIYSAGYSHLLRMPEFYDIEVMRHVLTLIEEINLLQEMFQTHMEDYPVKVIFGAELGNKYLEPISVIYTDIDLAGKKCYFGVLGSNRFDYQYVVPMMRYFRNVLFELVSG